MSFSCYDLHMMVSESSHAVFSPSLLLTLSFHYRICIVLVSLDFIKVCVSAIQIVGSQVQQPELIALEQTIKSAMVPAGKAREVSLWRKAEMSLFCCSFKLSLHFVKHPPPFVIV